VGARVHDRLAVRARSEASPDRSRITRLLPDGLYHPDVQAADLYGNKGSKRLALTIADNV